ncbi:MAG: hypothetical protein JWQ84_3133 [Mucilaginibacter sp.]|nr:hypothetical protein [Mucilaginibacter sp.]
MMKYYMLLIYSNICISVQVFHPFQTFQAFRLIFWNTPGTSLKNFA